MAAEGQLKGIEYDEEEQQAYRDIVIPDSEDFLSVFDYLQNHYGVYSKGIESSNTYNDGICIDLGTR